MSKRGLSQMQRDAAGRWTRADVSLEDVLHPAKSTDVASSDSANDIAVHDPARGSFGSLYLALLGDLSTDDDDTLWWWDGGRRLPVDDHDQRGRPVLVGVDPPGQRPPRCRSAGPRRVLAGPDPAP